MLKLTVSFSRKVGEPNYGSRGASVAVEMELDAHTVRRPQVLRRYSRRLFRQLRRLVDEELFASADHRPKRLAVVSEASARNSEPGPVTAIAASAHCRPENGNGPGSAGRFRAATAAQLRAIRRLAGKAAVDPDELARGRFGRSGLEELSRQEASQLIDQLQSSPPADEGADAA